MLRLLFACFFFLCGSLAAQDGLIPNSQYRSDIPDYPSVLGYEVGERISPHANVVRFFEALQKARPDQIQLRPYAKSWEGRELFYVVLGSKANMAKLDSIQNNIQALADPRKTSQAEADRLIENLPGVVWLSYAVHGNEISPTDAGMMLAYHLLASQNDPVVSEILDQTLVIIDPLQNPDGRDRFVHQFEMALGSSPQSDPLAAEHDEPWPSGRVNHYLFDLNRDWLTVTQPETKGRVEALQQWYPLAFVDAHEMGPNSTYFFAPEAIPYNPNLAASQRDALKLFGRNNARWFDRFGIDYFTREIFDAFYPGYGASWPAYFGSIAMTYEQASSRGLVMRRNDGSEFDYRETVQHHFLTTLATAQTVAQQREKLLGDFYSYRQSAIQEGASEKVRTYLIPTQADQAGADRLAGLLALQGVELTRADNSFSACGQQYSNGSYVISLDQPAKRLIRTLLDPQVDMEASFLKEQEARRDRGLPDEIYDVTAWSLPLMFNVSMNACGRAVSISGVKANSEMIRPGSVTQSDSAFAYIARGGDQASLRLMTAALKAGLKLKSNQEAFVIDGKTFPSGSLIIKRSDNPADLYQQLSVMARQTGARIDSVNSSWVVDGPSFGSEKTVNLIAPKIALAWDQPTIMYSAGATRYVVEQQFSYPVTPIRSYQLSRADLSRYDVVILPEQGWGTYQQILGEAGAINLAAWVRAGGVLVLLGTAMDYASDPAINLLSTRREDAAIDADDKKSNQDDEEGSTVPGRLIADRQDYLDQIEPDKASPDGVSGVLARAMVDPDHWMSAGVASELNVLVRGRSIFRPLALDQGTNVARFADEENLLVSGYLWEENKKQLAYKPFVVTEPKGRGMVIGFTQDPTVRAYLEGLNAIFLNALFRAPAYTSKVR